MKRLLVIIMTLSMSLSLVVTASAAEGSFNHFIVTAPEVYPRFQDIDQSKWYGAERQGVIQTACDLGILNGMSSTQFLPEGNLRLNEAVKIACMVHSIYYGTQEDIQELPGGKDWAKPYFAYAVENGILPEEGLGEETAYATRAQMAYLFAHCLPEEGLMGINPVAAISDVASYEVEAVQYAQEIFVLYRAGVLTGDAEDHAFRPRDTITRAETAAIVTRLAILWERAKVEIFDKYGVTAACPEFGITNQSGEVLCMGQQPYAVLQAFADSEPLESTIMAVSGEYGENAMLFVTETWEGYSVNYYVGQMSPQEIYVDSITLTGPEVTILNGLGVGISTEELLAAYEGEELNYSPSQFVGDFAYWSDPYYSYQPGGDYPWCFINFIMDEDTTHIEKIRMSNLSPAL
ncbi:MAG: S-layer homology domain-containing protein [Ruminiclostridium sp.]|nr:S-layer homology domain-containing protein [Ruminiclostridium sp.]